MAVEPCLLVTANHDTAAADPFAVVRAVIEERDAFGRYIRDQAVEIVRLANLIEEGR